MLVCNLSELRQFIVAGSLEPCVQIVLVTAAG
jgi:hypothetical protein